MKNIKRIAYIVLFVILLVLSLTIYTNASKDNEKDQKDKVFLQIKYMEGKIANLLNTMNNIEARNYSVVTSEMSKATTEKSNSENKSSSGGSEKSSSSSSSGGQESSSSGEESSGDASQGATEDEEEKEQKFELKMQGVLTNSKEINWDIAKSEVENLYSSLPSITMDLYRQNIKQEDILGFNSEYDKLTSCVKEEKKDETLEELTKVYEYFPKFLRASNQEELYITLIETKLNVFKGYAKLDGENWQEISNDIKNAIDTYAKLLANTRN